MTFWWTHLNLFAFSKYQTSNKKGMWRSLPKKIFWKSLMKLILELAELIDEQQFRCIFLVFNVDLNQTLQRDRPPPPRKTMTYIFAPGVNNWFWQRPLHTHIYIYTHVFNLFVSLYLPHIHICMLQFTWFIYIYIYHIHIHIYIYTI